MKKNFKVNISGILFNIDEDAYSKLNAYLERLKSHFKGSSEGDEIINDIENRIAEMMQARLSDTKTVIVIEDIEEIISKMGEPTDFEEEDTYEQAKEEYTEAKQKGTSKRFYRDVDNGMLAGVSSGLSAYFSVDPIWFRLAFILLTFGGGSGVLIYLLLWIIIPEAKTAAQKLEMSGEAVNIENIERKIKEEFENINEKLNDLKDKHFKKKDGSVSKGRNLIEDFANLIIQILKAIIKFAGFVFAIAFGFAAVLILILFFIGIFPSHDLILNNFNGFAFYSFPNFFEFVYASSSDINLAITSLVIIFLVPVIAILYSSLRVIFGIKNRIPYMGFAFTVIWITGLILGSISAIDLSKEFSYQDEIETVLRTDSISSDTLFVKLQDMNLRSIDKSDASIMIEDEQEFFMMKEQMYVLSNVSTFEHDKDYFEIVIEKQSRGENNRKANALAKNIEFNYSLNNNQFKFSPYYIINKDDKLRGQDVEIYIYYPEDKYVVFNENEIYNKDFPDVNRHFKWQFD